MEENRNNLLQQNAKYIVVIIGIILLLASYFFGYSKYKTEISDIQDEISILDKRYNDLKSKESKRKQYEKDKETAEKDYNDILNKFDAGLSTERLIMDCYNIETDTEVNISSITFAEQALTYVFGTEDKNGVLKEKEKNMIPEMIGNSRVYSIEATGTYNAIKKFIGSIMNDDAKRRAPNNISFAFDSTLDTVTCNVRLTEYSIVDAQRKESTTIIPDFNLGMDNIFFTSIINNEDIQ